MKMTVKQLRSMLNELPDDMVILKPSRDHSYTELYGCGVEYVTYSEKYRHWAEYWSDDSMREDEEKRSAFVVGAG